MEVAIVARTNAAPVQDPMPAFAREGYAVAVIACLKQSRSAWSREIDIRQALENF